MSEKSLELCEKNLSHPTFFWSLEISTQGGLSGEIARKSSKDSIFYRFSSHSRDGLRDMNLKKHVFWGYEIHEYNQLHFSYCHEKLIFEKMYERPM